MMGMSGGSLALQRLWEHEIRLKRSLHRSIKGFCIPWSLAFAMWFAK